MSTIPAQAVLGDRVAQIDAGPPPDESGADPRLIHIASVLQHYTNTYMAETADSKVVLDPSEQNPAPKRACMGALSGDTEPPVTPWQAPWVFAEAQLIERVD